MTTDDDGKQLKQLLIAMATLALRMMVTTTTKITQVTQVYVAMKSNRRPAYVSLSWLKVWY